MKLATLRKTLSAVQNWVITRRKQRTQRTSSEIVNKGISDFLGISFAHPTTRDESWDHFRPVYQKHLSVKYLSQQIGIDK